jgi:hypothetical protein
VIFFLCSNCVIFGAFRTTLDVVVVQPSWFEQGMFAVLKSCLFRAKCILIIMMVARGLLMFPPYCIKSAIISTTLMYHVFNLCKLVKERVRPPGSRFVNFIKLYGSRFFFVVKSGFTTH